MIEEGLSFNYIYQTYGINANLPKVLWRKYKEEGAIGLEKRRFF